MKDQKTKIEWQLPEPFIYEVSVLPEDTYRLGHTNNVRYLEWLEKVAWQHFEQVGYGWSAMECSGYALAITRTELNYLHASYVGDSLLLGTWLTSNDQRFKCGRVFQLVRRSDAKIILNAKMEFACIALANGRPAKMPPDMSNVLNIALTVVA